ncbi:alpha/beta hydrolase [Brevundimonas intermedia]|uniref:Alpha/beta hydrolase n=1 Tax=Brevundimonas intermedia TaxID=74315 RepID=A0A4Y9RUR9_9CAUL|nr:CocE/NonD family hydrolase [Brevundimonas intermedia]TFW12814.1 alpha/beta hydrolase [Brevundimonas intermedia]
MSQSWLIAALTLIVSTVAVPALAQAPGADVDERPDPAVVCHVGVYRLDDGSWVDVAPLAGKGLRWRRLDGSTSRMMLDAQGHWVSTLGSTTRVEGPQPQLGPCDEGRIVFEGQAGRRLSQDTRDTTFVGQGGTHLKGRLILPPGDGAVPIMVEVHGSEGANALDFNVFQRFAPAEGVGVFVYAKRGSGGSEGRYTQDFHVLADDAAAAVVEARRLAGNRAGRVGLHGASQGGWIAPLAASLTPVDFVTVGFGLAYGALAEDSDQVMLDLKAKGWGADVLDLARQITDVTGAFIASHGEVGFAGLEAVRAKYGAQPWFADIKGEFTGFLLTTPNAQIIAMAPVLDAGTSWDYDPLPVLSRLDTPMLWIQAEDDLGAPPDATRQRLIDLAGQGRPITLLEYPDTDHGIARFEAAPDGKRTSIGYAPGYYQAVLDWAKTGRLDGRYGDGRLLATPSPRGR